MSCKECPYAKSGCQRLRGEGKKGASLMVIGEAPFITDFKVSRPFASRGGRLIRETLEFVGVPEDDYYMTYLIPCKDADYQDGCMVQLGKEVEKVNPKCILVIGAEAAKRIIPEFHKSTQHSGKLYNTVFNIPGLATVHPSVILRYKGAENFLTMHNDIYKAWRRARELSTTYSNPHTETEIATYKTMPSILDRINKEAKVIAYDWETTGLDPKKDHGWCLGLSWKIGHGVSIPVDIVHAYEKELCFLFNRKDIAFVAFNGMFDIKFNKREGIPERLDHDPMLMHTLLDERPQRRSLENLTALYCDAEPYESKLMTKYNCTKAEMIDKVPAEEIHKYCCKDVDYTLRLYYILLDEIKKEPGLLKVYKLLIIPGAKTFADIQEHGFWVDNARLQEVTEQEEEKLQELQSKLNDLVGHEINPRSPKQVATHLWDTLGLEEPQLIGRKNRSTDSQTREALLENYPDNEFVKTLDAYKISYTILSRYLNKIPEAKDDDNRLRSHYHLDRTATGRIAATNFAIHQMPKRDDVRGILTAGPGNSLIQADYAQVEMRMAAHLANDTYFNEKIFKAGVDFHSKMAAETAGIPLDEVTSEKRGAAKGVSFGLLYLMTDKGLANNTGLPLKEAIKFVKDYKAIMPKVMQWIEEIKKTMLRDREVTSLFGRKRRFPFIIRGRGGNLFDLQREAVNMPIQSSASDLTLWQVIKLHRIFKEKYHNTVKIVTTVHDSIIVECPDYLVQEVGWLMKKEMEKTPFKTDVPFVVDVTVGKRWGEENELELT